MLQAILQLITVKLQTTSLYFGIYMMTCKITKETQLFKTGRMENINSLVKYGPDTGKWD